MKTRALTYFASALIVVAMLFGTYFITMRYYVSASSLTFYRSVAGEVGSVLKVLQFGEKNYGPEQFKNLDCDVYATFYSSISSYKEDLKDPYFVISDKAATEAREVLNGAIQRLKSYKDRHGEKNCSSGTIILSSPLTNTQ